MCECVCVCVCVCVCGDTERQSGETGYVCVERYDRDYGGIGRIKRDHRETKREVETHRGNHWETMGSEGLIGGP